MGAHERYPPAFALVGAILVVASLAWTRNPL